MDKNKRECAFCGKVADIKEFEIIIDKEGNKLFNHKKCSWKSPI